MEIILLGIIMIMLGIKELVRLGIFQLMLVQLVLPVVLLLLQFLMTLELCYLNQLFKC